MKLRNLVVFQIVCEEMNMTKAGKRLHLSQPAVSQIIKDIEGHYCVKLFERSSNSLNLTEAGETLLHHTKRMMIVHDEMEEAMERLISK